MSKEKSKKKKSSKKMQGKAEKNACREGIIAILKKSGKKPVSFKELLKKMRGSRGFEFDEFVKTVEKLKTKGVIIENKLGLMLVDKKDLTKCVISRLNKTYGFARITETDEEIFVSGKFLRGAMPGDVVLARVYEGSGASREGEVIEILEENFSRFTGEIVLEFGEYKIVPDTLSKYAMDFDNPNNFELHEHDKVMAEITKRGQKHSEHRCMITASFGSSLKAAVCALSVLEINGITPVFPPEVIYEAKQVSDYRRIKEELPHRLDLRDKIIFTIDGADTKDIDDAVSFERTEDGYELGVHIADVSHYVTPRSALDNEAFKRGTSVYYANRVIPMLPAELSNGICSLNPQEDRLAFSCIARLDSNANIISYKFAKTVIRSRVKGVYSEINELLDGYNSKELCEKYAEVMDVFPIMTELAEKLSRKKLSRGAPQLETPEGALIINEEDVCVGVVPYQRGASQEMIEDFMLTANECAARFGLENGLPFVYRIHEDPTAEKFETLVDGLSRLGISYNFNGAPKPADMSKILEQVKGTDISMIVNNMILRSMSKARYSTEPVGHYGLVLDDYAHFTSPIRRYPDLTIHRIMSDFLSGTSAEECRQKYNKFVYASADQSTQTELTAMQVERSCEDCYKAEYLKAHMGEEFDGMIVSVMEFGMFVALPDTCEGLVSVHSLSEGEYYYDGMMTLKNLNTGESWRVGDAVRVKVENADVNSGKVDFVLC